MVLVLWMRYRHIIWILYVDRLYIFAQILCRYFPLKSVSKKCFAGVLIISNICSIVVNDCTTNPELNANSRVFRLGNISVDKIIQNCLFHYNDSFFYKEINHKNKRILYNVAPLFPLLACRLVILRIKIQRSSTTSIS